MKKNSKMRHNDSEKNVRKGFTPVFMMSMFILFTIVVALAYQNWIGDYLLGKYSEAEEKDIDLPIIDKHVGNFLYLKNPSNEDLHVKKIFVEGRDCFVYNLTIPKGITEVQLFNCTKGTSKTRISEVVIYADEEIVTKRIIFDIGNSGTGSGNMYSFDDGYVTDCGQLALIRNDLDGDYFLVKDLYCYETRLWNNGTGFEPIGDSNISFTGTFDGRGFTIYGIFVNNTEKYTGFFGSLDSANISNLNLKDLSITGEKKDSGGLAGYVTNSTISHITVSGNISGERKETGGVIGNMIDSVVIDCSFNYGNVMSDKKSAGGLIGNSDNSLIRNSFARGNVYSDEKSAGGLVGYLDGSIVVNSYSTGNVSTDKGRTGGLIGEQMGSSVTGSYWDMETSGQGTSEGGTGKTTAEMMNQSTYVGWDFADIWEMSGSYPTLM